MNELTNESTTSLEKTKRRNAEDRARLDWIIRNKIDITFSDVGTGTGWYVWKAVEDPTGPDPCFKSEHLRQAIDLGRRNWGYSCGEAKRTGENRHIKPESRKFVHHG